MNIVTAAEAHYSFFKGRRSVLWLGLVEAKSDAILELGNICIFLGLQPLREKVFSFL